MYKNILVAFDKCPEGKYVFEVSLNLAKVSNASLMLLHILSKDSKDSHVHSAVSSVGSTSESVDTSRQKWKQFGQDSLDFLKSHVQQAQAEGVKAEFMQMDGHPGKTICAFAKEWGADLIVVGRRGYSAAEEMFLGSVSSYVIHQSHCSVHVVQV
jgi:nucleotide-binding universal stress UspA family protein